MVLEHNNSYWPALTGVRALAAFMVFVHHYNPFTPQIFGLSISNFFREFHVGVTLFFVLSGFLIANRYYFKKNFHFKNYMVNRIARIYPIYFILTTLIFMGFAIFNEENSINKIFVYISNITFIRGYFEDYKFSGLAQGWSLTVEETFYCLAPLFFYTIRKTRTALLIWPIVCTLIGLLLVHIFKSVEFYGFMKSNTFMLLYTFFGRCFEFFFGIALALFLRKTSNSIKTKHLTYFGGLIILLCVFAISFIGSVDSSGLLHPNGILINNIILPSFGICLFYYGLIKEHTVISKVLSSKYAVLLGKSSIDNKIIVFTDKSTSYVNIADYVELHMTEKSTKKSTKETLRWVHITKSNAKKNLLGNYHKIKGKYLQLYLNEFIYKLNRRYFGERIFERLVIASITGL